MRINMHVCIELKLIEEEEDDEKLGKKRKPQTGPGQTHCAIKDNNYKRKDQRKRKRKRKRKSCVISSTISIIKRLILKYYWEILQVLYML